MLKSEYKKSKKELANEKKELIADYKSERPPLIERIKVTYKKVVVKVKYWIKVVKIIYDSVFHAWIRIQELKKENQKLKDDIISVIEATERNDTPIGFTINRLKNLVKI